MTKLPVRTTEAILTCHGTRMWTLHRYAHSELISLPGLRKNDPPLMGWAHYFRCTETGQIRRWGFDATSRKDDGAN